MKDTVTIAGKPVELKATASTIRNYRAWFNRDLIKDFKLVQRGLEADANLSGEVIELVENLTYVMAKQADPTIPSIEEWLDQFETFPISEFAVQVVMLWVSSMQTLSEPKNV